MKPLSRAFIMMLLFVCPLSASGDAVIYADCLTPIHFHYEVANYGPPPLTTPYFVVVSDNEELCTAGKKIEEELTLSG
jgi:hypothetical protein